MHARTHARVAMDCSVYRAAQYGDINFLQKESNISEILLQETVQQKDNVLHIAANFKQLAFAKEAVRLERGLLFRANSKGDIPLHIASRTGCSAMVDHFILSAAETPRHGNERTRENSRQVNMLSRANQEGDTALHVAVKYCHFEVVNSLILADVNLLTMVNRADESPLYLAIERGFFGIGKHFLDFWPQCSHKGNEGMTALHAAVVRTHQGFEFRGSFSVLSLERRLQSSTRDFSWRLKGCFLGNASRENVGAGRENIDPELLSLERFRRFVYNQIFKLFPNGTEIDAHRTDCIMRELLEKKKDVIRETDIHRRTPLHYATQLGHLEATRKFLQCDNSVAYLGDEEGSSALHIAAKKGFINIMEEIAQHCPCAYHLVDGKGQTILHVAAKFGKSKAVSYILKVQGWESLINETDSQGNTALHLAAMYGHYMSVWILAGDHRVDRRATNKEYLKAIDIIQSNNDVGEVKKYLIMRKLEKGGAGQSLHRLLSRDQIDTDRKNKGYNEEPKQDKKKKLELGEDSRARIISLNADEPLRDRNSEVVKKKEITSKYLKDVSNTHLLVSTLIATVTFAAGFSLPGGYNEDDPNKGKTVLSTRADFKTFVITDAIAFYCSTAAVFLHFFASLEQSYHLLRRFVKFAALLTYISILAMVIAFTSGIYAVLPDSSPISTTSIVLGAVFLSFYIFGIL